MQNPNDPATKSQTFCIFRLGGGDVRGQNLTKIQASDMIKALLAEKDSAPKADKAPSKPNFKKIIAEATKAADAAGDKWMADHTSPAYAVKDGFSGKIVGTMLDVCGFGWIEITDGRTAFAKWAKANGHTHRFLHLNTKYRMRQEMGLNVACASAGLAVLQEHGIKGVGLYSRID